MVIDSYDSLIKKLIEVEELTKKAVSFYKCRNLTQSIVLSDKVFEIINEIEKCSSQIRLMFEKHNPGFKLAVFLDAYKKEVNWILAISNVQLGKFQNAIKVLSLSLKDSGIHRDNYSYYHNLTQFIEVAQKIPMDNNVVCKAQSDVATFLSQNGKLHWRHELILMKSRYEMLKGNFEDAYFLAKEALALSLMSVKNEDKYSGQVWDFHYDGLVSICLALNKVVEAKSYISQWINSENQMPINRLIRINKCLSDIARFENDFIEAEKYAKIATKYSDDTDYEETQFSCLCSLLNSLIGLNKFDEVKNYFSKISKLESSERLFVKYHMFLIKLKLFKGNISDRNQVPETEQLLIKYASKLNQLLSINYYHKDLFNINKTIVY